MPLFEKRKHNKTWYNPILDDVIVFEYVCLFVFPSLWALSSRLKIGRAD